MMQVFTDLGVDPDQVDSFDFTSGSIAQVAKGTTIDKNKIILKGNLIKKNRWLKKQLRFFILYQNGELMYYKDITDFKGSIKVGPNSKVRKTAKTTISMTCERKGKEYILM